MNLKQRTHNLLHTLGIDVVPYSGRYFPARKRMEILSSRSAGIVIDVGANEGQFAQEIRRDGWTGSIVSFEPLADAYAKLSDRARLDPRWTAQNVAVGAAAGIATINVAANSWSSSLLGMTPAHAAAAPQSQYERTTDVRVEPLDELDLPANSYLKIDTQGYELEVLNGAKGTLAQCFAVECELSLIELYEGQPLFEQVHRYLRDRGFFPVDLWPTFIDPLGEILQLNGIFVRT